MLHQMYPCQLPSILLRNYVLRSRVESKDDLLETPQRAMDRKAKGEGNELRVANCARNEMSSENHESLGKQRTTEGNRWLEGLWERTEMNAECFEQACPLSPSSSAGNASTSARILLQATSILLPSTNRPLARVVRALSGKGARSKVWRKFGKRCLTLV